MYFANKPPVFLDDVNIVVVQTDVNAVALVKCSYQGNALLIPLLSCLCVSAALPLHPAEERVDDVLHSYEKEIVHIDHDVDLIVF